jgi:hypothetical protein
LALLEYISERHFLGRSNEVCEYSIATEVLGRPADFDPAQDAISRVEMHRLRKKLREYYASEGVNRPVRIVIPSGLYTPVFQVQSALATPAVSNSNNGTQAVENPVVAEPVAEVAAAPPATPSRWGGRRWSLLLVIPLAALTVFGLRLDRGKVRSESSVPAGVVQAPPIAATGDAIRIVAGYDRPNYIDHHGRTWQADKFFEGGGRPGIPIRQFIARTSDPLLYQGGRIGLTGYNLPLKPGAYEMKLHFVEPVYGPGLETGGGENSRVFDILLNGKMLLSDFDIVSDAGGPLVADVRVFKDVHPGPDGYVRLAFHAKREQPLINAIEIEPAKPHRINPVRIVTQGNTVTDSEGHIWGADQYYLGGQNSNHWITVAGTPDADLFRNERYGHFSYAIPVAEGSYDVNLYFAETYWGPRNPGKSGDGSRVFDVYCNGATLLHNFDIYKEAGSNTALIKRFRGLHPNAQGKLDLEFVPVVNYASVFAIEVLDEGR